MSEGRVYDTAHDTCAIGDDCGAVDCPAAKAAVNRLKQRGSRWGRLSLKKEAGGLRHYLDGRAVHCGDTLVLQRTETRYDDYGSYDVAHDDGAHVRYEASWRTGKIDATLHTAVAGVVFATGLESWHRFRWPS